MWGDTEKIAAKYILYFEHINRKFTCLTLMSYFVSPSASLGSVIYRERVCDRKKIII